MSLTKDRVDTLSAVTLLVTEAVTREGCAAGDVVTRCHSRSVTTRAFGGLQLLSVVVIVVDGLRSDFGSFFLLGFGGDGVGAIICGGSFGGAGGEGGVPWAAGDC